MDVVYASLHRRIKVLADPTSEVSEVLDALWAHATLEDGLEHASGRAGTDHVDLLMYLLTLDPTVPGFRSVTQRVSSLLHRCHAGSPLMQGRYLPPDGPF
ncbi:MULTISPECIES: hypothetical protein [unclassified Streptomyces]|uniref:hypothetical protein n=1 Tax=unclassified Streptomyces TaxID=2593676 RepID=UPI0010461CF4|nr:hypothetical protein OH827_02560 [Streptomyces sp. NBC_00891]WSY03975.1 hypothetical protein OG464_02560 [Streptomyces sp. NBC_00890]WSZ05601.1 hypothetical protein OG704_02560 [Streptomyces sp. NBC_00869]WSZ26903.1 hypothetical protein OG498_31005 [Streptomyces sp. NBC_00870]